MSIRNENRPGYKKTKVGWIPEEWDIFKLKELTIINPVNLVENTPGDYCFYYIDLGSVKGGDIHLPSEKISFRNAPLRARRIVRNGDILLSTVRPNLKNFVYVVLDTNDLICSTGFAVIRARDRIDGRFIYHNLYSRYSSRYFYGCVVGSGYPALNGSDIEQLSVPIPPYHEQGKIADILSNWDEAIEQTRKLIDAKKRRKKAFMQQLLTGKRRSGNYDSGHWQIRALHDLLETVSRPVPKPQKPYLSIGVRSHGRGTFQRITEQPGKVMMDTLYRVESHDLIVNITFAWEGAIAIASQQDSGGLVSHRFPTYRIREKEADIDFIRNLILTKRFVWDLGLISPGGAGRNRVLNQRDFLKLRVLVPSVEMQDRIGKILTAAESEIRLSEHYLDALEMQKRGLMQKLLTGEVRVDT